MATKKTATKNTKAPEKKGDKARKAAIAEIKTRIATIDKPEKPDSFEAELNDAVQPTKTKVRPPRVPKTPIAKAPPKTKKVSALDAAYKVLSASKEPMRAVDLIAEMEKDGLWKSPGGKTPEATLYAALIREIAAKGKEARFKKADRGLFVATKTT